MIAQALADPAMMAGLGLEAWDRLLREARATQLIARLAWVVRTQALAAQLPEVVRDFLLAHEDLATAQAEAVRYEAAEILGALKPVGCPVVFLKGSAYILAGNAARHGRLLGDIDILVPQEHLRDAELMLKLAGWTNAQYSEYDQQYFRKWMHELPAMQHIKRRTTLDVHHTILPPTARSKPSPGMLLADAKPIDGIAGALTLSDTDMLIHCATHLFHEGEFEKGLRDLHDFNVLLFARADTDRGRQLAERGMELDLAWPLYLALRYNSKVFADATGDAPMAILESRLEPSRVVLAAFDAMFARAFLPHHPLYRGPAIDFARWLLYIRSHWLRMPPHLLAYHLGRKALLRLRADDEEAESRPN